MLLLHNPSEIHALYIPHTLSFFIWVKRFTRQAHTFVHKGKNANNYAENLSTKKFSRQEFVHPCLKPSFRYKGIKPALYEDLNPRLPVRHYRFPPRATLKNSPFWGSGVGR